MNEETPPPAGGSGRERACVWLFEWVWVFECVVVGGELKVEYLVDAKSDWSKIV